MMNNSFIDEVEIEEDAYQNPAPLMINYQWLEMIGEDPPQDDHLFQVLEEEVVAEAVLDEMMEMNEFVWEEEIPEILQWVEEMEEEEVEEEEIDFFVHLPRAEGDTPPSSPEPLRKRRLSMPE